MAILFRKDHMNKWFGVQLTITNDLWYYTGADGFRKTFFFSFGYATKVEGKAKAYSLVILGLKLSWGLKHHEQ